MSSEPISAISSGAANREILMERVWTRERQASWLSLSGCSVGRWFDGLRDARPRHAQQVTPQGGLILIRLLSNIYLSVSRQRRWLRQLLRESER